MLICSGIATIADYTTKPKKIGKGIHSFWKKLINATDTSVLF